MIQDILHFVFSIGFLKILNLIRKLLYMFYSCSDLVVQGAKLSSIDVLSKAKK